MQQIIRWDMAVLRESPWYQKIERRDIQLGLQQVLQRQLIRVLRRRFGEIPHKVEARLEGESVEKLETLMDSALAKLTGDIAVNSLDEFVSILSM
ncbi:DUF4351 domain-containing protein [Nostoc sp.]|uniref:DUF4351 domain-containing protein n=1 Tax=Nostoc sp. TaxID=1180 RepID=UPI002FF442DD